MRTALTGLPRYVTSIETAKHRWLTFLDASIRPDNMLTNVGLEDAWFLGVMSSRIHVVWALAAGGRLGVGDDPRYNKAKCFDTLPFPDADEVTRRRVRALAERPDAHRKARQAAHPDLTITGMYNVLAKLRSGEPLTDNERVTHDHALVAILRELHDALDAGIVGAYGWPSDIHAEGILWKLVALNVERAAEESRNVIRWLRPEFQQPTPAAGEALTLGLTAIAPEQLAPAPVQWSATLSDRIAAVREALARTEAAMSVAAMALQ